jgi:hypothetical protein
VYPDKFLHQDYLEILDKLLSMDDHEIKSMVLEGIFKLFESLEIIGKNREILYDFIQRKKDKLFYHCLDKNSKLALKALLLFAEIRSKNPEVYTHKHVKQVKTLSS